MPHPALYIDWTAVLADALGRLLLSAATIAVLAGVTRWLAGLLVRRAKSPWLSFLVWVAWGGARIGSDALSSRLRLGGVESFAVGVQIWAMAVSAVVAVVLLIPLASPPGLGVAPARPARARIGLLMPGLGHLACGDLIPGIGLLLLDGVILWALVAGLPRYPALLFPPPAGMAPHALIGLDAAIAGTAAVWLVAWRYAFPPRYDEEAFNSTWGVFVRQFQRNRTGMLGLFGALVILAFALMTPMIAPFDPDAFVAGNEMAPSRAHLLGTDIYGRDLFSRVLYGGRISLSIGFIAVSISATIGVSVGAIAGYVGGWIDRSLMWVVDLLLSLPSLVLLLALVGLFRTSGASSIFLIVTILGFTGWMGVSRIVRSQILSLKEQDFIQAARALGFSTGRIVFRHLIPNAIAPVIVYCSLAVGAIIVAEAGLSFLGLGVSPPTSTWGTLVSDGREPLRTAPWIATFPGLCIVAAVMSFNLLGDGLRDALDPKLRGR